MTEHADVVVAGLGTIGSAALHHLAARDLDVRGLDAHSPPHDRGSHSGLTRIIREAYFEDPRYVPLVQRAYELWTEIQDPDAAPILRETGGLMIGPPDGVLVEGALRSARTHDLDHEVLEPAAVRERFPAFRLAEGEVAVHEPRAGVLDANRAIHRHLEVAHTAGARTSPGVSIRGYRAYRGERPEIVVQTSGDELTCDRLVLALGAALPEAAPGLDLPITVTRQLLHWFEAEGNDHGPDRFPVFIWEFGPGRFFYGFPDLGRGVKLAIHGEGEETTPARLRREVTPRDWAELAGLLPDRLPGLAPAPRADAICMYASTPDDHFILDRHPADDRVVLAGGGSGHAFKFAPALGEAVAALATGETPGHDLSLFSLDRFA